MQKFLLGVLVIMLAAANCAPASAGYTDYYVKRLANSQYDGPNAPYQTTVGGPFSELSDCQYEARADAREDNYHHIFQCSMGR